jgi:hypothetical protein
MIQPTAPRPKFVFVRLLGAGVITLLVLAITVPNLAVPDLVTHKTYWTIGSYMCFAVMLLPFGITTLGVFRSRVLEKAGWGLLFVLFALRLISS